MHTIQPENNGAEEQQFVCFTPPESDRMLPWLAALSAVSIPYRVIQSGEDWILCVPADCAQRAREELAAYETVNAGWPAHDQTYRPESVPVAAGTPAGIIPPLLILGIHLLLVRFTSQNAVEAHAAADSTLILQGEWWRAITALLLHSDFPHVLGNTIFFIIFAPAILAESGPGLGWFLVLAGGAVGNLMSALFVGPGHVAIGASTASFAALGILTVTQAVRNYRHFGNIASIWSRTWIPVAAGIAILGVLGTSPRADLAGHFCGFTAGLFFGGIYAGVVKQKPKGWIQGTCGLVALFLLLLAWHIAFAPER